MARPAAANAAVADAASAAGRCCCCCCCCCLPPLLLLLPLPMAMLLPLPMPRTLPMPLPKNHICWQDLPSPMGDGAFCNIRFMRNAREIYEKYEVNKRSSKHNSVGPADLFCAQFCSHPKLAQSGPRTAQSPKAAQDGWMQFFVC